MGRRAFCRLLPLFLLVLKGKGRAVAQPVPGRRKSRVVVVHDGGASPGAGLDNADLDQEVVRRMVAQGILALTGAPDLKSAWRSIIPDRSKKVAIKVNCQIKGIFTKQKVVWPVVEGLIAAGVKADNIIIYDMTDKAFELAGFRRNTGAGVKVGTVSDFGGYGRLLYHRLANLLTGGHDTSGMNLITRAVNGPKGRWDCEYLINIPVLKALDGYCGVTLSMKNHYGSIGNPAQHHEDIMRHIPLINSLPEIREKTRLVLLDAIFGEYRWQNGRSQQYVTRVNKLVFANDPVAVDYFGWQMIEKLRKEHGLGAVDPQPAYIAAAAGLGLGVNDPARMELIELETGAANKRRGK